MDQCVLTPEVAARGWEAVSPGPGGSAGAVVYSTRRLVPRPLQATLQDDGPDDVWVIAEPAGSADDTPHSWWCRVEFLDGSAWGVYLARGADDVPHVAEILAQFNLWASGLVSAFLDATPARARETEAA